MISVKGVFTKYRNWYHKDLVQEINREMTYIKLIPVV